jgi:molecular chaperone DnaJ
MSMSLDHDPHEDLGVPADATIEEIHSAFRRLIRKHHPDTRPEPGAADLDSDQALQRILRAYDTLREHHALPDPPRLLLPMDTQSPPLVATPVQWERTTPAYPRPAPQQSGFPAHSIESLARWLLGSGNSDWSSQRLL